MRFFSVERSCPTRNIVWHKTHRENIDRRTDGTDERLSTHSGVSCHKALLPPLPPPFIFGFHGGFFRLAIFPFRTHDTCAASGGRRDDRAVGCGPGEGGGAFNGALAASIGVKVYGTVGAARRCLSVFLCFATWCVGAGAATVIVLSPPPRIQIPFAIRKQSR